MKEIQGKVKFMVIPIPNSITWARLDDNDLGGLISSKLGLGKKFLQYGTKSAYMYSPEHFYSLQNYKNPILIGKLSEITEEQAAELVNLAWAQNEVIRYKTAKESLVSLLKANGCCIKDWVEKPEGKFIDLESDKVDWIVGRAKINYKNTPDDYLLIKLL